MRGKLLIAGVWAVTLVLAGCAEAGSPPPGTNTATPASPEPEISSTDATTVRFSSGDVFVDVTIAPDNPTGRDLLSILPLTLSVEEFAGQEKISHLPRHLDTAESPGSRPVVGDLSYYVPWGNLVFYYDVEGIGYSDQTIRLGSYSATAEQLARLEGSAVTVDVVE